MGKGIDPGLKISLHLFPEAEIWVLLWAECSSRHKLNCSRCQGEPWAHFWPISLPFQVLWNQGSCILSGSSNQGELPSKIRACLGMGHRSYPSLGFFPYKMQGKDGINDHSLLIASGLSSIYIILIWDLNYVLSTLRQEWVKVSMPVKWEFKKLANFSSTKVGIQ